MANDGIERRHVVILMGSALLLRMPSPWIMRALNELSGELLKRFGGLTPNSEFYVTSYDGTPRLDAQSYVLKIGGLVRSPLTLSLAQVRELPQIREILTLECISNPPDGDAIGNAEWTGVKLRPILERVGLESAAKWAVMRGADGYETGVPVDEIMREENFLAYMMNGAPLPAEHGFPLRIFIPGKYGMKQPKWLTEISFVDKEFVGYWERRGWSQSAWRKVNSGFFYPKTKRSSLLRWFGRELKLKAPVDLVGWALAGPSGIRKVEVSTDDGKTFEAAELLDNHSPYVWTIWHYRFSPKAPGRYKIRVRATDGNGISQPPDDYQTGSGRSAQPSLEVTISL